MFDPCWISTKVRIDGYDRIIRLTGSMRKSRREGEQRQTGSHGQDYRQDPITSWKALPPRAFILSRVFSSKSAYPWINYRQGEGKRESMRFYSILFFSSSSSRSNSTYIINPNCDSKLNITLWYTIYYIKFSSQQVFSHVSLSQTILYWSNKNHVKKKKKRKKEKLLYLANQKLNSTTKERKFKQNDLPSNSHPVFYTNKKRGLTSFVPKYPYLPHPYPLNFFVPFLPMREGRTKEGGVTERKREGGREELHGQ